MLFKFISFVMPVNFTIGDDSFIIYSTFSEKLTFLTRSFSEYFRNVINE